MVLVGEASLGHGTVCVLQARPDTLGRSCICKCQGDLPTRLDPGGSHEKSGWAVGLEGVAEGLADGCRLCGSWLAQKLAAV